MSNGISHTRWLLYFVPRILFGYWLIWWVPHTIGAVLGLFLHSGNYEIMDAVSPILMAYRSVADPYFFWYAENWPWPTLITIIGLWLFFMERSVRKGHFRYNLQR